MGSREAVEEQAVGGLFSNPRRDTACHRGMVARHMFEGGVAPPTTSQGRRALAGIGVVTVQINIG